MGTRACPDCNATVSNSASSCPVCGYIPWRVRAVRTCYAAIAVSWALATTNTSLIFGGAFSEIMLYVAASTLYLSILVLLAIPIAQVINRIGEVR